jgi:hypothetical protein
MEEKTDKVAAASRNDADQILGVLLDSLSLKWIDLVADDASYCRWFHRSGQAEQCIAKHQGRADRRSCPQ